jgi:hypothetical protein
MFPIRLVEKGRVTMKIRYVLLLLALTALISAPASVNSQDAKSDCGDLGRFRIVLSTLNAADTFIIDTKSGDTWQLRNGKAGEPVWQRVTVSDQ